MKRLPGFLAPLALLLVTAEAAADGGVVAGGHTPELPQPVATLPISFMRWQPEVWRQVRIQRRFSIRITPGITIMPPAIMQQLQQLQQLEEAERAGRSSDRCLAIAGIVGVQPGDRNELLLFLRDQRVVSLQLEKHCNAQAFYSGFYVAGDADGAICAGRDILQSRSGSNCQVRRLNELVPPGYRRIP